MSQVNLSCQFFFHTIYRQYFHLLRRQVKSKFRKPLVTLTPKSLLRLPAAVSTIDELTQGSFQTIIDDTNTLKDPKTVLFCSGKIYYELAARRMDLESTDIAILRIEQFYPFARELLSTVVKKYSGARQWCWVQEEPENMGGWQFIRPRLEEVIKQSLIYIGREAVSSPATGFPVIFRREQNEIIDKAVGPPAGSPQQAEVS